MHEQGLNDNHRRRLKTSMVMVDSAVGRMLDLVEKRNSPKLLSTLEPSMSEADLRAFRDLLLELQTRAAELAKLYDLGKQIRTEKQVLMAEVSHIWTVLENCRPARMKGYGVVPETEAQPLEAHVQAILNLLEQLTRVLVG